MKTEIKNIEDIRALNEKEILLTNASGGYLSTTAVLSNRRKYHSLFACNLENEQYDNISLLASLDETIITKNGNYELATHAYPETVYPQGFRYLKTFDDSPCVTYRTPDFSIRKEFVFPRQANQLMVRYTVEEASNEVLIRLTPLFAYRNVHSLTHANDQADATVTARDGDFSLRLYPELPQLHIQCNSRIDFFPDKRWYYNFRYETERQRGYDFEEDLLAAGYFEKRANKGDVFILSFSVRNENPESFDLLFERERSKRQNMTTLDQKLALAAEQFIVEQRGNTNIIAGYPWFGNWGRDTFISLPGLTLSTNRTDACEAVIDSMIRYLREGLFINMGQAYNSADAPMWFFWTLQQLEEKTSATHIAEKYYLVMKSILEAYRYGRNEGIAMRDNGLIYAAIPGKALTWMDAIVSTGPVTARDGYAVEINALWYNAVCYTLALAQTLKDQDFIDQWGWVPEKTKESFRKMFLNEHHPYLADYANDEDVFFDLRPNQLIAGSLRYGMLTKTEKKEMLKTVKKHLLTPYGLRTLTRQDYRYKPVCAGDQHQRDEAYHNGTIWVWQLEHYVQCGFDVEGEKFGKEAQKIYDGFAPLTEIFGLGSIAEIYNGDPPHTPGGTISQAWSVGALLRIRQMIEQNKINQ